MGEAFSERCPSKPLVKSSSLCALIDPQIWRFLYPIYGGYCLGNLDIIFHSQDLNMVEYFLADLLNTSYQYRSLEFIVHMAVFRSLFTSETTIYGANSKLKLKKNGGDFRRASLAQNPLSNCISPAIKRLKIPAGKLFELPPSPQTCGGSHPASTPPRSAGLPSKRVSPPLDPFPTRQSPLGCGRPYGDS